MASLALIWDLIAVDKASGTFNRVAVSADRAAASTGKAEAGVMGFSKKAVAALGALATVDIAAHIVKDAAQFQKSMTLIQTQAGASAKQVRQFSSEILNLSGKVAQSPEDLSTSLYHVYSALNKVGASGPQMMNAVKIAAEGAKVGMASVEDTTNSLTATMASGIVRFDQAGKAMGALNAIVGAGDMHFQDLNDALGTGLLVTMKTFGVSLTDTGAALSIFGDNNIRGADAATKLRMAVQDLAKPAAHADDYLKKIHLSADQLRKTLEDQGLNGALHLLSDRMTQFGITGSKVGGFLADAFTKKAGTGLAILTQRMTQFDEARKAVQKGANGFGSAWQAVTQTASFAFDRIKATVEAWAIEIGTELLPMVSQAAQGIGDNLPKALHTLGDVLGPTAHLVGDMLAGAFHLLVDVLKPVAAALGAVGRFIANNTFGKGMVTAVLVLWGAFKGYTILRTAAIAVDVFFGQLVQKAVTAGVAVQTAMQKTATAAGAAKAALGGLAAGVSFGLMARGASGATQAVSALGAAAIGAAQGFAVGGVFGAAVGGSIGLLSSLATSLFGASDASAKVNAEANTLTGTLNKQTGAITKLSVATQAHALEQDGTLKAAQQLGLSLHDVTMAALGNADATHRLATAYRAYMAERMKLLSMPASNKRDAELGQLNNLIPAWGKLTDSVATGKQATDQASASMVRVNTAIKGATDATIYHNTVVTKDMIATMELKQQTNQLKDALSGVASRLNDAAAAVAWQQSLNDLTTTFKTNKGALDGHSAAALADKAALIGDLQTVVQHAQAMQKAGKSVSAVTGYLHDQYGALRQHATDAGADGKQVDALARSLGALPKQIEARIKIDPTEALNAIANVKVAIANLPSGNYRLSSNGASVGASLKATGGPIVGPGTGTSDQVPIMASNGEHMLTASDVSKAGGQGAIYRMRSMIQAGLMRFASGGAINSYVTGAGFRGRNAQIMDAIVMAESGGNAQAHNYNPSTQDDSYGLAQINLWGSLRSRLQQFHLGSPSALYNPATNLRVAYALSGQGSNFSPWSTYKSGAYLKFMGDGGSVSYSGDGGGSAGSAAGRANQRRSNAISNANSALGAVTGAPGSPPISMSGFSWGAFTSQLAAASRAVGDAVRSGAGKKQIDKLMGHLEELRKRGNRVEQILQARALRAFGRTDLSGSVGSVMGRIRGEESGLTALGLSKSFVNGLTDDNRKIADAVRARNTAANNLARANAALKNAKATLNQDRATYSSAVSGTFDITQAGVDPVTGRITGSGIVAQARQAVTRARLWVQGMEKLGRSHIFPVSYLRALFAQGPAALEQVQALLSLPKSQLRELAKAQSDLSAYSTVAGVVGVGRLDQGAVNTAQNRVNRDQRELNNRVEKLRHDVQEVTHTIKHGLDRLQPIGEDALIAMVHRGERKAKRRA